MGKMWNDGGDAPVSRSTGWKKPLIVFGFTLLATFILGTQAGAREDGTPGQTPPSLSSALQISQVLSQEIQAFGLGAAGTAGLLWLGNRKAKK